ncbi:rhomboid domain-containing protein 3 [Thalassophryne amazonica]|uniref:rhomboid domain-containing protein 3 n=1 Tax=Thalassophryne amazonica TaxID=390379 RepID=UPI001471CF90|nr:rhomboid domain-containing protein 3 [Thalassophryne amazonica]XP_034026189.1 rhomboid domain-containing protein 3 [Thalassophryne amazonica]
MLRRILSSWFWFGSDHSGFILGTFSLVALILLMYVGGIQSALTVGPGGDLPKMKDVLVHSFSHDELHSLLVSVGLLLLFGPCQERRWGTVAFLALSILTIAMLPLLYVVVLFVGGGEASRICGYSAVQLALFTVQCRQTTQRRPLRCLPIWFLPWLFLLVGLLLLPSTPALLHFCAICIGHNYRQSFIGMLQELEKVRVFDFIPDWVCIFTSARLRLPTYTTSHRSPSEVMFIDQAVLPLTQRDSSPLKQHSQLGPTPSWLMETSALLSETEVLEEQMLRAGILASLQNAPEDPDAKAVVPKSSVSSLRLQQLEKMGFPTEKAVVALAASKQLDGAISLLIEDSVGEEAVVVSKGKSRLTTT